MASTRPAGYCIIYTALFVVQVYLSASSASASNTSCPTWFYFNSTTQQCECGKQIEGIQCNHKEKIVEILLGHCVTYAGQESLYYTGICPFIPKKHNTNRMLFQLPSDPDMLNDAMCGPYNRTGLLCGRCIDGYGPAVFSFDGRCADCSEHSTGYAIIIYLSVKLIPITLFFMCVLFFRLNITAGPLLGYVVFCQIYACTLQSYQYINFQMLEPTKVLLHESSLTLSELWILQYFRLVIPPLCLSTKLTNIHIQMLSLVTDIYPITLVITTCILMELHARNYGIIHILWMIISILIKKLNIAFVTSDTVIHTFATFILLSAFSLTYTVSTLCTGEHVHRSTDGTIYQHVLRCDSTIIWFSTKHILYFLPAVVIFIFLLLIPSLLLCLYPTRIYRYLSQYISIRKQLAITAFAEALHNCFKDGLNGTRDYRALAALFIIGPAVTALMDFILREIFDYPKYLASGLLFTLFSFVISCVRPCKVILANLSLSYHFMVLGILSVMLHLWAEELAIGATPLIWASITAPIVSHVLVLMWIGYKLIHWIVSRLRYQLNCNVAMAYLINGIKQHLHKRHDGYQVLPGTTTR